MWIDWWPYTLSTDNTANPGTPAVIAPCASTTIAETITLDAMPGAKVSGLHNIVMPGAATLPGRFLFPAQPAASSRRCRTRTP
jgi:hypothetical protein